MRIRIFCLVLVLVALHPTAEAGQNNPSPPNQPLQATPNVVLILADDLGYGDLGVYGAEHVTTPNLDQLANQGIRFSQFYGSPVCSPSRIRLFTGRSPQKLGFRRQIKESKSMRGIPAEVVTMAEMFVERGYRTAHYGKWHMGRNRPEYLPFQQGFTEGAFRTDHLYWNPKFELPDGTHEPTEGHSTTILTDFAIDFLESQTEATPFLLSLSYWAPHKTSSEPDKDKRYFPPDVWAADYEDSRWGRRSAQIAHLDHEIGRLLERLDELDLTDETVIVFASDNGAVDFGEGQTPNGNIRGSKGELFEGGIRLPLIISGLGNLPPNSEVSTVYCLEDIYPTFAEVLNFDTQGLELDGYSFLASLSEQEVEPRENQLVWEYRPAKSTSSQPEILTNNYVVREGNYKLVVSADSKDRSIVTEALYSMSGPNQEATNLAIRNPELTEHLKSIYRNWRLEELSMTYEVEALKGAAEQEGDRFVFDDTGQVELMSSSKFEVSDGDFTFSTLVTLDSQTLNGSTSEIATKKNSWRLFVTPSGKARVLIDNEDGSQVQLDSADPLPANEALRISFTITSWKSSANTLKLYLGDTLQGESTLEDRVRSNEEGVLFGSRGKKMTNPFLGTIEKPLLFHASLNAEELGRL